MSDLIFQSDGVALSKEQVQFNKLVLQIEELKVKLVDERKKLDARLSVFETKIFPLTNKEMEYDGELVKIVYRLLDGNYFSQAMGAPAFEYVLTMLRELMYCNGIDDEHRKILDEITEQETSAYRRSYGYNNEEEDEKDDKESDEQEEEDDLNAEAFFEEFINGGYATMEDFIKAKFFNAKNEKKEKKKSKSQLKKEALEKEKEKLKAKSLKDVYHGLCKMLHPDLEKDHDLKLEKEVMMKEVVDAYEKNDLSKLLAIEVALVTRDKSRIKEIAKEKLKVYLSIFNEQIGKLNQEINHLIYEPHYDMIRVFQYQSDKQFEQKVNEIVREQKRTIEDKQSVVKSDLSKRPNKKLLYNLIKAQQENEQYRNPFLNFF